MTAVSEIGDDELFDELEIWLVETTKANGVLPTPAALKKKARDLCTAEGVEIPADSPLRT
jgi:hypothetical protein